MGRVAQLSARQGTSADYVLVKDGQPAAVIIISAAAGAAEQIAATDLREFVEKASGARLPVRAETESRHASGTIEIHIGHTKALWESAALAKPLAPEEFVVAGGEGKIFLAGCDTAIAKGPPRREVAGKKSNPPPFAPRERAGGTHAALVHFVEQCLGGAFLWPGSLGTVVPRGQSLTAHVQLVRYRPPMAQRGIRNMDTNPARYLTPARAKGLGEAELQSRIADSERWMLNRGLGGRLKVSIGHSTTGWWDRYGRTEPTLFALQPSGIRGPVAASNLPQFRSAKDVKQCTTNARVVENIATEMREFFTRQPDAEVFPLAMNDGRYHGFCMCERCKALDDPRAGPVNLLFTDAAGKIEAVPYRFLTDRYAVYWRTCAERLAEMYPGKKIAVYAYGALEAPPVSQPLPANLVVGFVGPETMYYEESVRQATLARWDGWVALGAKLIFRPNIHYPGYGLPVGYSRRLDADLKQFHRSGCLLGTDFDALHMSFGTQGHNHFVLARLLWNPESSRDEIMAEFCGKAFGAAADHMREYFELLEDVTTDTAVTTDRGEQWLVRYGQRLVDRKGDHIRRCFREASAAVPEESPERQRVEFFRAGYRYAEMVQAAVVATLRAARGEIPDETRSRAVEELQAEFDRHARDSWVVDRIAIGEGIIRRSWAQVLAGLAKKDPTLRSQL